MSTSDLAVSAAGTQTFHPFPRLPPELRLQIWRDALPEKDSPAFTPYQSSGWTLVPASEAMHANNPRQIVEWKFHPESLDKIRVKIPLANVNYEARHVAIEWARKQGIEVIFHGYRDCWGVHPSHGPPASHVSHPCKVGQFALPESVVVDGDSLHSLYSAIVTFDGDVVMYIVAGEKPNPTAMFVDHTKVQPRWELCDAQEGEAFVWDRNNKRFEAKGGPRILQYDSYQRVLAVSKVIGEWMIEFMRDIDFEIRAVRAIRV